MPLSEEPTVDDGPMRKKWIIPANRFAVLLGCKQLGLHPVKDYQTLFYGFRVTRPWGRGVQLIR
jgi:hypothetical protein